MKLKMAPHCRVLIVFAVFYALGEVERVDSRTAKLTNDEPDDNQEERKLNLEINNGRRDGRKTLAAALRTTLPPKLDTSTKCTGGATTFNNCMEMGALKPLLKIGCTDDLQRFLCSQYAPVCEEGGSLPPCRELCVAAHSGCSRIMTWFGLHWPDHLQCARYPVSGGSVKCVLRQTFHDDDNNDNNNNGDGQGAKENKDSNIFKVLGRSKSKKTKKLLPPHPVAAVVAEEDNDTIMKMLSRSGYMDDAVTRWPVEKRGVQCSTVSYAQCRNMGVLQSLLQIGCADHLQYFLCSIYAPVCDEGVPLPPCRELCWRAHRGCSHSMYWFGLSWPSHLQCKRFPRSGRGEKCVNRRMYEDREAEESRRVDGAWGSWGAMSTCSSSCGGGNKMRTRSCDQPAPKNGGAECKGAGVEEQACNLAPCPVDGNWGDWTDFGECSESCGGGKSTRSRLCNNPSPANGGLPCAGSESEEQACNTQLCPVDGNWGDWTDFSECTESCGGGKSTRSRLCNNPSPANGGLPCAGSESEQQACNVQLCPVHGNWGEWTNFGKCSTSCGMGSQSRSRLCNNPPPMHGGDECEGTDVEETECNLTECPVNGNWGDWTDFGECSESCGGGKSTRSRLCNNPSPANGGKPCVGSASEQQACNTQSCPVHGNWGDWTSFGKCSTSCGVGSQSRSRLCNNPPPMHGGDVCEGSDVEQTQCNLTECPVDGNWGDWTDFGECSETCGAGKTTRNRLCNNPSPANGGKPCAGSASEQQACSTQLCPVNGNWGNWGPYSACSKTCGMSRQLRSRSCDNPAPSGGGTPCIGHAEERQNCILPQCNKGIPGKLPEPDRRWGTIAPPVTIATEPTSAPTTVQPFGIQCSSMPFKVCKNMDELKPLLNLGCTDHLQYFLCSVYAPVCENEVPIPPCRELCETAHRGCANIMYWFGFQWPRSLDCRWFPRKNSGRKCVVRETYLSESLRPPVPPAVDPEDIVAPEDPEDVEGPSESQENETPRAIATLDDTAEREAPAYRQQPETRKPDEKKTITTAKFKIIPYSEPIEDGWRQATVEDVEANMEVVKRVLAFERRLLVAKIKDASVIGSGFGYKIDKMYNSGWTENLLVKLGHEVKSTETPAAIISTNDDRDEDTENDSSNWFGKPGYRENVLTRGPDSDTDQKQKETADETTADKSKVEVPSFKKPMLVAYSPRKQHKEVALTKKCSSLSFKTCRTMGMFSPLLTIGCSADLQHFLCGVYAPVCEQGVPVPPCRELCERATSGRGCIIKMRWFGFKWPAHLTCDRYPRSDSGARCVYQGTGRSGALIRGNRPTGEDNDSILQMLGRPGYRKKPIVTFRGVSKINGQWSEWSAFSKCSTSCGDGERTRSRVCDQPKPENGGEMCQGVDKQQITCNLKHCPVSGGWGLWGPYGECTRTCEGGTQRRSRLCDSPQPEHGGAPCVGQHSQETQCNLQPCPVDGNWGDWADFGECSESCGGGKSTRSRLCNNPSPANGGKPCVGSASEQQACNTQLCPVHGNWGEWTSFSKCSTSCGVGSQSRSRLCNNPPPMHGGDKCEGTDVEQTQCNLTECPVLKENDSMMKVIEGSLRSGYKERFATMWPPTPAPNKNVDSSSCSPIPFTECKKMGMFTPLLELGCSPNMQHFLCSVYAPVCNNDAPVPPCRNLCHSVKSGCDRVIGRFGFEWPERLSCSRYPVKGPGVKCVDEPINDSRAFFRDISKSPAATED